MPRFLPRQTTMVLLALLTLGVGIFYRSSYQVPLSAAGLALFALGAFVRPDLSLLFVPLTVPLFFMPKGIWDARFGIRPEGLRFPLHEVVLVVVLGAALFHGLRLVLQRKGHFSRIDGSVQGHAVGETKPANFSLFGRQCRPKREKKGFSGAFGPRQPPSPERSRIDLGSLAREWAPIMLFLLAGTVGVFAATSKGDALREWRWLIVEPVIFYALVRVYVVYDAQLCTKLLAAFLISGACVGLIGIGQFFDVNLAPFIGDKVGFSADQIQVEGVERVTSVYGHPNNLGLLMGRIWPIAATCALGVWLNRRHTRNAQWQLAFFVSCTVCALGGLIVSFSKGALLGAGAAVIVLVWLLARGEGSTMRRLRWVALGGGVAVGVLLVGATLLGVERLNLFGESSAIRLKTWAAALAMLRDHPLTGIGLDQFGRIYPTYMAPELAQSNERFTSHPHNLLLDILLRMGPLGLAAFGWLSVRFFRQERQRTNRFLAAGLCAAMVAALVHGFVDNFYFVPDLAFTFWLLIALSKSPQAPIPTPQAMPQNVV